MNYNNGYFIIFITLLHYLSVSFQVTNANREGSNSCIIDGVHIKDIDIQDLQEDDHDFATSNPVLEFQPSVLDFRKRYIGMPHLETIHIFNRDEDEIHLFSISGSTVHFHCSFFNDKVLRPGANTTFDVVFLARTQCPVNHTLFLHTSKGTHIYKVIGRGEPNPYRVSAIISAEVPVNSSFSKVIYLHNPHSTSLQIHEIYTSGNDLHLEMPTGRYNGDKITWNIDPYDTKPVIKASFLARDVFNHTVFLRIRTNVEAKTRRRLVVPLEIQVKADKGLYSPVEEIDFGIVRSSDTDVVIRTVRLYNSDTVTVHVNSIRIEPDIPALRLEFNPLLLKADVLRPTAVARIYLDPSKLNKKSKTKGYITLSTTKERYQIRIPFRINIMFGSLDYDRSHTYFYTGDPIVYDVAHPLEFTNHFSRPVTVFDITVATGFQSLFNVSKLVKPLIIRSGRTMTVCRLTFQPNISDLHVNTHLYLHTNASVFAVPLYAYNGKVQITFDKGDSTIKHITGLKKDGRLNFGTVTLHGKTKASFILYNDNPVKFNFDSVRVHLNGTSVKFLGQESGNLTRVKESLNKAESDIQKLSILPFYSALFQIDIETPTTKGSHFTDIIIRNKYQNVYIPISIRATKGDLKLKRKLQLKNCFPTRKCYADVYLKNTYDHDVGIKCIDFLPTDSRYTMITYNNSLFDTFCKTKTSKNTFIGSLSKSAVEYVGVVQFDMKQHCIDGNDCYVGFHVDTEENSGDQWMAGLQLKPAVINTDIALYDKAVNEYNSYHLSTKDNKTLVVTANEFDEFYFNVDAEIIWPRLSNRSNIYSFITTRIGNTDVIEIPLVNPSSQNLLIHIVPLRYYPDPRRIISLMSPIPWRIIETLNFENISPHEKDAFILSNKENYKHNNFKDTFKFNENTSFNILMPSLDDFISGHSSDYSEISDGDKMTVSVCFKPFDTKKRSEIFIIRNNLTILEFFIVTGRGGANRANFTEPVLQNMHFNLDETSVGNFQPVKKDIPVYSISATLSVRNDGDITLFVVDTLIHDLSCRGYGFKIKKCGTEVPKIRIPPKSTYKFDIFYTADLSLNHVQRNVRVFVHSCIPLAEKNKAVLPEEICNHEPTQRFEAFRFNITATLSPVIAEKLESMIYLVPSFFHNFHVISVIMMFTMCFGVCIVAFIDSGRIISKEVVKWVYEPDKVLNFKRITQEIDSYKDVISELMDADDQQPHKSHKKTSSYIGLLVSYIFSKLYFIYKYLTNFGDIKFDKELENKDNIYEFNESDYSPNSNNNKKMQKEKHHLSLEDLQFHAKEKQLNEQHNILLKELQEKLVLQEQIHQKHLKRQEAETRIHEELLKEHQKLLRDDKCLLQHEHQERLAKQQEQKKMKQEQQKQLKIKQEKQKQDKIEKIEKQKLDKIKQEQQKRELELLKQQRLKQEKLEQEKIKSEHLKQEQLKQEQYKELQKQEKLKQEQYKELQKQEKLKQDMLIKQNKLNQEQKKLEKLNQEQQKQEQLIKESEQLKKYKSTIEDDTKKQPDNGLNSNKDIINDLKEVKKEYETKSVSMISPTEEIVEKQPMESSHLNKSKNKVILKPLIISSTSGEQSYNDKIDRSTSSSESSLSPSESLPSWDTPADPMAMGDMESLSRETENFATHFMMDCYSSSQEDVKSKEYKRPLKKVLRKNNTKQANHISNKIGETIAEYKPAQSMKTTPFQMEYHRQTSQSPTSPPLNLTSPPPPPPPPPHHQPHWVSEYMSMQPPPQLPPQVVKMTSPPLYSTKPPPITYVTQYSGGGGGGGHSSDSQTSPLQQLSRQRSAPTSPPPQPPNVYPSSSSIAPVHRYPNTTGTPIAPPTLKYPPGYSNENFSTSPPSVNHQRHIEFMQRHQQQQQQQQQQQLQQQLQKRGNPYNQSPSPPPLPPPPPRMQSPPTYHNGVYIHTPHQPTEQRSQHHHGYQVHDNANTLELHHQWENAKAKPHYHDDRQLTFMQKLQIERRQLLLNHNKEKQILQQQETLQTDWPGFDESKIHYPWSSQGHQSSSSTAPTPAAERYAAAQAAAAASTSAASGSGSWKVPVDGMEYVIPRPWSNSAGSSADIWTDNTTNNGHKAFNAAVGSIWSNNDKKKDIWSFNS